MEDEYDNTTKEAERLQIDIEPPELIGGVGFGLILFFAIIKDVLDVFFLLFSLAMAATGMGIVVTIIISTIKFLISLIISLLIWFYFFYKRVKFTTKVFTRIIFMVIVELMPIFNGLPMSTITVLSIRSIENKRRKSKFVDESIEAVAAIGKRLKLGR